MLEILAAEGTLPAKRVLPLSRMTFVQGPFQLRKSGVLLGPMSPQTIGPLASIHHHSWKPYTVPLILFTFPDRQVDVKSKEVNLLTITVSTILIKGPDTFHSPGSSNSQ